MKAKNPDIRAMKDPEGQLETALIEEFLLARGVDAAALRALPDAEAKRMLTEASVHAAAKLAEIDARAHFVREIHGR
jgi:hypothetical protein